MSKRTEALPVRISFKKTVCKISDIFQKSSEKDRSIRILTYHSIPDEYVPFEWMQMTTPKELFEKHMRYLKENGYTTVTAGEVLGILASGDEIPPKTVCITFDDGYKNNYKNAFPVMKRYGLKGTVFVTADFIGKEGGPFGGYLNWDEIKEMKTSGSFTFGCHSLTHENLARLDNNRLSGEIKDAKRILEERTDGKVETFAYPFGWPGTFDREVVNTVKNEGFLAAFTGIYGKNTKKTDLFHLRRISVSWIDELDDFRRILSGAYDWYKTYQRVVSIWKRP